MSPIALFAVVALNAVTFVLFGVDKRRARLGKRRIPERRLLGLAWATGLLGAWIGMSLFRHKTRKRSFQAWMVLVTVLNLLWPISIGWPVDLTALVGGAG